MSSVQARPLTNRLLRRVLRSLQGRVVDHAEFLTVMCMFLAHDGLLRSAELFSGLRVKDVTWYAEDRSVTIYSNVPRLAEPVKVSMYVCVTTADRVDTSC